MTLRPFPRIAQLFGIAVVDQIVLSATSFAVGFLLIRRTTDTDYGLYVLVQSALLLATSVQWAWLIAPLTVVAQQKSAERRREMVGAANDGQRRFLARVAPVLLICAAALYLLGMRDRLTAGVFAAGILAVWIGLRRDYVRGVLMMYRRSQAVLIADLAYVTPLLIGTFLVAYAGAAAALWTVVALAAAGWCGYRSAMHQFDADPGWVSGDAGPVWREIRVVGIWSVIGAVIYWLFTQSYNYVLAARFDFGAVAAVNSARLLMMPINVLALGIISMLTPTAAAWLAEVGLKRLVHRLAVVFVCIAVIDAVYFALVWWLRDWLTVDILKKVIADRDRLLLLWTAVAVIALLRDVLQCALFALARQKSLAWLIGISAAAALATMWLGFGRFGPSAALIGQVAGEAINVIGLAILLSRHMQRVAGTVRP